MRDGMTTPRFTSSVRQPFLKIVSLDVKDKIDRLKSVMSQRKLYKFSHSYTGWLSDIRNDVDGVGDFAEDVVAVGLGRRQLRMADVSLRSRQQHHRILLQRRPRRGQVVTAARVFQVILNANVGFLLLFNKIGMCNFLSFPMTVIDLRSLPPFL